MNVGAGIMPRGIRNNNPGNIRFNEHAIWSGQVGSDEEGFVVFRDAYYGIRAMWILLVNYHIHNSCNSVIDYIDRWAPPKENDTDRYIIAVCKRTGWTTHYNPRIPEDLPALIKAIVIQENGSYPYNDTEMKTVQTYYPIRA